MRCCLHHFSIRDTGGVKHGLLNSEHGGGLQIGFLLARQESHGLIEVICYHAKFVEDFDSRTFSDGRGPPIQSLLPINGCAGL